MVALARGRALGVLDAVAFEVVRGRDGDEDAERDHEDDGQKPAKANGSEQHVEASAHRAAPR